MKFNPSIALLAIAASAIFVLAEDKSTFAIKDHDRVVFYGDSITDQRLYTTFTETFVITRFPKLNVSFVHSGWGGDRVGGGGGGKIDVRLKRDVYAYKPTVMTVMLGMNDGSYRAFDQKIFDTYSQGYAHIVEDVKKTLPGIRLTLIQPSPYDDVTRPPGFEGGYNAVLIRYGNYVKELAQKEGASVADLNTAVVAALQKANTTDATQAKKIVNDRVHPGASGHLLMAAELLKSWNAPGQVTAVEIDAAGKKVVRSEGTKVVGLKTDGGISWTQNDTALPMPVDMSDPVMALAVNSSDFVQTLNQQPLKVTGLAAGNYTLKIDGETVGSFSEGALSNGINLAMLPTPMAKQAKDVHALTLQHNNVHFLRWRQIEVPLATQKPPGSDASFNAMLKSCDAYEADIVKHQHATAQPMSRKYSLVIQ